MSQANPAGSELGTIPPVTGLEAAAAPTHAHPQHTPRTWLVELPQAGDDYRTALDIPAHIRTVVAGVVVEQADADDCVLISGSEIAVIVQACQELLTKGVTVALDARKLPALRGLVSRREYGTEWVRLEPASHIRMPLLLGRLSDVLAGAIAALVTAPVLGVLMIGVRATSPGRAIFPSPRVGRDGLGFNLFKLRTMRSSNQPDHTVRKEQYQDFMKIRNAPTAKKLKVVDSSRVTPFGRFLRKHSLDELPQFWNVVRGDLSFVGPRPCLPYEWDLHEDWHRLRFRSRPGLTGYWQAYGRSRVTFEEMVLMDYCYGWRKSLLLDLRIVFRTAIVVITGEGGG